MVVEYGRAVRLEAVEDVRVIEAETRGWTESNARACPALLSEKGPQPGRGMVVDTATRVEPSVERQPPLRLSGHLDPVAMTAKTTHAIEFVNLFTAKTELGQTRELHGEFGTNNPVLEAARVVIIDPIGKVR